MPLKPTKDEALRLREFFSTYGYTEAGLAEALGSAVPPQQIARPKALWLTHNNSPLSALIRLFFLGVPTTSQVLSATLPEWFVDYCLAAGLLTIEADELTPEVALIPVGDYLLASDALTISNMNRSDFVLPASSATARYMLDFVLRKPAGKVLDLGTGCGVLAHFASEFSDSVVATDINPRATEYALFNAQLNERNHIDCRTGNLFEPIAGSLFDLIITNPPFVLAPCKQFTYRDNEMVLDEFCAMLARTAPNYLDDGGYFQMICEWVEIEDAPWHERLGTWFENSNCDVWVLHGAPQTPEEYAQVRVAEASQQEQDEDIATYAEWMQYYRANKVKDVHSGVVTMRRRDGKNWIRFQALSSKIAGPVYPAIESGFAARDVLESRIDDDTLEELFPAVSADARLAQSLNWSGSQWTSAGTFIQLTSGLHDELHLDEGAVDFMSQFDGTKSISECIDQFAEPRGEDADSAKKQYLPIIQALIERGFLVLQH